MTSIWKNKRVWVTGASSGIGEAFVKELDQAGAHIILSSRRENVLQQLLEGLANKSQHTILPLDVSDSVALSSVIESNQTLVNEVDVLINCAGLSQRALAWEATESSERYLMETNFFGTVALSKAVLPGMMQRNQGLIINMSSVTGKFGFPLRSAYAASKHALHGYFDSLRLELQKEGKKVQILIACPGRIATPISLSALTADGSKQNEMDPGLATGIAPDVCARDILRAAEAGKTEIYIGKEQFLIYLKRYWPALFRFVASRVKPK